jgi:hypothetical protein
MTPGRRSISYQSFQEIMPDVDRLLNGHTTVGRWSMAQICRHVATVMRRVVDLPASTPHDPSQLVSDEQKRQVFESNMIPESLPGPPELMPPERLDVHQEVEGLRHAIAHYTASPGPVIKHRLFGKLSKDEWDRLQLMHAAHHLSFVVPA